MLPPVYDPDGDGYNVVVDFGRASMFASYRTFKQRSIILSPTNDHIEAKTYKIIIMLSDTSIVPKRSKYILEVLVKSNTTDNVQDDS